MGCIADCEQLHSPNCNERPEGVQPSLLVIHAISLPPGEYGGSYISQFFTNQLKIDSHPYFETISSLQVSSHFLIERSGKVTQFVSTEQRAWHAGQSEFNGKTNCNDYSIGIELEGTDDSPFTEVQYQKLALLTKVIQHKYPVIGQQRIVGHSDIAPRRKTDPGKFFEWEKYFNLLS